jgi:two-component system chemotaxis response regulator CheY
MVGVTLRQAGYEVIESAGPEEALTYAREHEVDLVLVDLYMPRMDGIELIKALRTLPSYRLTPILMLTTESSPYRKMQAKQAGAMGWIVKPFKPGQMLLAIERALGNSSLASVASD